MDETKYVVLAFLYGAFVRGDIVTAADLPVPPEFVIANGDIRAATPEEAALGRVPAEALGDVPQADTNAVTRFATIEALAAANRAVNPQKGAVVVEEAPRAITDDAKTRRLDAAEVKEAGHAAP